MKHFKGNPGPHLVVVPKTTIQNWAREFARWVPDFNVVVLSGTKEERGEIIREQLLDSKFEVCITSYEVCLIEKAVFRKFSFSYIVIDEAHRIKNVNSILSRIVREFVSRNRMLITGTPLQNNLQELFSLLNFICPEIFSDYKDLESFLHKDVKPASGTTTAAQSGAPSVAGDGAKEEGESDVKMEEEASPAEDVPTKTDKELEEAKSRKVVEALHKILRPFLLRRVKADVERNLLPSTFIMARSRLRILIYSCKRDRNQHLCGSGGDAEKVVSLCPGKGYRRSQWLDWSQGRQGAVDEHRHAGLSLSSRNLTVDLTDEFPSFVKLLATRTSSMAQNQAHLTLPTST